MLLIKNGFIINQQKRQDILIENGIIKEIGQIEKENIPTIDASKYIVTPGLIDVHVHFRDPGFTYKEDIESGSKAAMAGGFTTVVAMANTNPAIDDVDIYKEVQERENKLPIHVLQACNVTKGLKGKEFVDIKALKEAGALLLTDDGIPINDETLMYEAMKQASLYHIPLSLHEEDPHFVYNPGINAGKVAHELGIKGAESMAEELLVARDCLLALHSGATIDIQHLSSKTSVDIIKSMKEKGVHLYAEVTPQHLILTEEDVLKHGSLAKINPPFRTKEDQEALILGLKEGTIDMIVTDHAPHSIEEKSKEKITDCPSGIIGLETSLALMNTYIVEKGYLTLQEVIEKMTINPARFLNIEAGLIEVGKKADICLFDQNQEWILTEDDLKGKSVNTPFIGTKLKGKVKYTICEGQIVYEDC